MRDYFVNKNVEFIYAGNVVLRWLISDFFLSMTNRCNIYLFIRLNENVN